MNKIHISYKFFNINKEPNFQRNEKEKRAFKVFTPMKANAHTKSIPAVVLNSSKVHSQNDRAWALRANSYPIKQIKFEKFAKLVANRGFY